MKSLKYWRTMRALSIKELAEQAGVNYSTISLLENGHRSPQPKTIKRLAKTLEIPIEELYKEPPVELHPKSDRQPVISALAV